MNKRLALDAASIQSMEATGIYLHGAAFLLDDTNGPDPMRRDFTLAQDAQPTLVTTANSGIPAFLTTIVDPSLLRILTAKNKAAKIIGEVRKGSWVDQTAMFPVAEQTGEVSAYGDYSANGRAGMNMTFPQRQSFNYQTFIEYGDLEMERAGLAKVQYASELKDAAANILAKFQNLSYFYGVTGLQNYGILNDPSLSAALTPATKAATGTSWITSGGVINATANEVYADIQALFTKLVTQTAGNVDLNSESDMVLVMSPKSSVALTITNSFGITVADMLKKSYPNMAIETAVQYGALTAQNPQGLAGGELVQLIARKVEGQESGYCAYNEKLRTFPVVRSDSSYRQKFMQGTWGAIIRQPFAFTQMQGI